MPNFKCKNITIKIKNSVSEKLLCVINDNKLDFTEHLKTLCKKINLNLYFLKRISTFLFAEQYVLIISAYLKYLFSYSIACSFGCSAKGALCTKPTRLNKTHEGSLRLLLKNYKDYFQDLLRYSGDISIYQRCINVINWSIQIYSWSFSWNKVFSTTQRTQTSLRGLQNVVKRSQRLSTKSDVVTTSGRRRRFYNVLMTSVKRCVCSNSMATSIHYQKKWFLLVLYWLKDLEKCKCFYLG